MRSLAKQLQECVAANKRAVQPVRLTFTSFKGVCKSTSSFRAPPVAKHSRTPPPPPLQHCDLTFWGSIFMVPDRPACPCTGPLRQFCEGMGGERWAADRVEAPTLECCPPASVVLLSPDAPQPLEAIDPARTYVVGGLVDRSPRKGITALVGRTCCAGRVEGPPVISGAWTPCELSPLLSDCGRQPRLKQPWSEEMSSLEILAEDAF